MQKWSRFLVIAAVALLVGASALFRSSKSDGQEATPPTIPSSTCAALGADATPVPEHAVGLFHTTTIVTGYTVRLSKIVFEPGESADVNLDAAIWTYVDCGEIELQVLVGSAEIEAPPASATTVAATTTVTLQQGDAFFTDTGGNETKLTNTGTSDAIVLTGALVSTSEVDGCDALICHGGWP